MGISQIALRDLASLSEKEIFQAILSSADQFPGLYRMRTSWKNTFESPEFLKLMSFLEVAHMSEKGKRWSKEEWFKSHLRLFDIAYGERSRNEQRAESDLKSLLKQKAWNHFSKPQSYSLALIDSETEVQQIEMGRTYYMMGSLIHFAQNRVLISYDDHSDSQALTLNISFDEAQRYIEQTFSSQSLVALFLQAEVIAQLNFQNDQEGQLHCKSDQLASLVMKYPLNTSVFAAPSYQRTLPIRFAKPLGVSNVLL